MRDTQPHRLINSTLTTDKAIRQSELFGCKGKPPTHRSTALSATYGNTGSPTSHKACQALRLVQRGDPRALGDLQIKNTKHRTKVTPQNRTKALLNEKERFVLYHDEATRKPNSASDCEHGARTHSKFDDVLSPPRGRGPRGPIHLWIQWCACLLR